MGILFQNLSADLMAVILIGLGTFYLYALYVYGYWKRRGIKFIKPTFPFGNFRQTFFQKIAIGNFLQNMYEQSTEPFIGIYGVLRPMLLLRDPQIIRTILIKDFQYFMDRGVYADEKSDPLSGHLFSLSGEKWKNLRVKLTPVFTSGKLKAMFGTIIDCGVPLQNFIEKCSANGDTFEARELSARYTTNIIASIAFGIDINCIDNPDTSFRYYGRKALELSIKNGLRAFTLFIYPKLQQVLKFKSVDDDVEEFILSLVKESINYRETNNISRKDLLQLLIQLRNTGKVKVDGEWDTEIEKNETNKLLSVTEMAAQAWIFFVAGFETSSTTLSFCLYELAKNQEIQQRVQKEIDDVMQRYNNQLTYESVGEMKYLESCIDETLRKYPALPLLNRECTKAYKIPGTNFIIEKGTTALIPILGLQMDPKYYPNPETFNPERFLSDGVSFNERPYLPFGDGPRACIGLRLAKIQTKVGLITMLQRFRYQLAPNMKRELVISPKMVLMAPVGGINLKVIRR